MKLPETIQYISPLSYAVLPTGCHRGSFESLTQKRIFDSDKPFIAKNAAFLGVFGGNPRVRVLAKGPAGFAHEAGVYIAATDEVWFTSNLIRNSADAFDVRVQVYRVALGDGSVSEVDIKAVACGNGACLYQQKILFCDQGRGHRELSQLVLVDPKDPSNAQPILNNLNGLSFNSLNDVIVLPVSASAPRETIWFTDPTYGYEQGFKHEPQLPPHVYVFDPTSGEVRVVEDGLSHPNGICFSPCGSTCYITDTSRIHGSGKIDPSLASTIYAYNVLWTDKESGPRLESKRVFAFADCGVPDGIKCDKRGNVYAGTGEGITVWNEHGMALGTIALGLGEGGDTGCANFCFVPGGRMVCMAENCVYLVEGLHVV